MKTITIDFKEVDSYEKLNEFLCDYLDLQSKMTGKYGYNFSAFWDMYGFCYDEDFFVLKNYKLIKNEDYKEQVDIFISILDDLKKYETDTGFVVPNPNFNYKIEN